MERRRWDSGELGDFNYVARHIYDRRHHRGNRDGLPVRTHRDRIERRQRRFV